MSTKVAIRRSYFSKFFTIFIGLVVFSGNALAEPLEIAFAGFAYSGSAASLDKRFPYSRRYELSLKDSGAPLGATLLRSLTSSPSEHIRVVSRIDELKGKDRAISVALVIGSETIAVEKFGGIYKLMTLIRGQSMFFDFKSMNVVRSYPISFAYVDTLDHEPSKWEIEDRVKLVYEGAKDKPGLLARFSASVGKATVPNQVSRYVQVTSARIAPEATQLLPSYIKDDPSAAESWAADLVSEAISTRAGIPIVPFAKGYAIGNVMSFQVSDGTVWELKLPKPDYELSVELSNLKKVKFAELPGGGTSYIYASYSQIRIEEPMTRKVYMNTALKNGETRVIPASQDYVDDAPHFYDSVNGMFVKLAQEIAGTGDGTWIKTAASASDISKQLAQTSELIKQCK
ncbi:MAG: hypothetical protein QM674_19205 [Burkholderiaceae bacterium]